MSRKILKIRNEYKKEKSKQRRNTKQSRTFLLCGFRQEPFELNSIPSFHNQIQTCIIEDVSSIPNFNKKSNPIYKLTKLQHLELRGCAIDELNEKISKLTSLQTLLLSNNSQLKKLPSSMTKLTSLQHLSLSHSRITSLPTQIGLLTQLHTLDLNSCNSLTNIPTELEHLTNLREFRLRGTTKINKFPLKMKNWIKLEVLELNSLNIEMIPSEVWMMTELKHLSLSGNKLSFIPSELYCLSNLTHLNLSSNQITHISNQINKLTQLQSLNLSYKQLTQIPDDISSLLHLSELWIENNKLKQFSSQLPPNLVDLNLGGNSITSISSTILFSLTRLEYLDLSGNQITILPTQIGLLTSLQILFLDNNKLSFIPSDLNSVTQLTQLSISRNRISLIPNLQLHLRWWNLETKSLKFPRVPFCEWSEFFDIQRDLYNN